MSTTNDAKKAINLPDLKYVKKYIDDGFYKKTDIVANATNAASADYATDAGMANFATDAGHANFADNAENATNATNAANANHASTADEADWAGNADFTDFTNNAWHDVTDADTGATDLVEGATYEVVPYKVSSSSSLTYKTAIAHGFITYDTEFSSYTYSGQTYNNDITVPLSDNTEFLLSGSGKITRTELYLYLVGGVLKVISKTTDTTLENGVWNTSSPNTINRKFKYRRIR